MLSPPLPPSSLCQDRSPSPREDDPPPSPCQELQPPSISSPPWPATPPSASFSSQPTTPPVKFLPSQPTTPKKRKIKPEELVPPVPYKWSVPPAPTVEAGPAQYVYGAPELHRRIMYAEKVKKIHVTPRLEMFFELYESTAHLALEKEKVNKEEAKEYKDRMRHYDHFLEWNACLCYEPVELQIQMEDNFLKLKQLEYLARYGDYVGSELQYLKDIVAFKESENYKQFHTYWTIMGSKMHRERCRLNRARGKVDLEELPILKGIWITGAAFKLMPERSEFPIHYHTHIRPVWNLMKTGRWHRLARALHFDEMELRLMISPTQDTDIDKMSTLIGVMKEAIFDVGPQDKQTPDAWVPSKSALGFYKYLNSEDETEKDKENQLEAHIKEVVRLNTEQYSKRQLEVAMVKEASKDLSLEVAHPESLFDKTILPRRQILETAIGIPPKSRGLQSLLRD